MPILLSWPATRAFWTCWPRQIRPSCPSFEIFGQIKDSLKRAGSPIPINGVWLAAQAVETGAVMVSYDEHFRKVQGIRLWDVLAQEPEGD